MGGIYTISVSSDDDITLGKEFHWGMIIGLSLLWSIVVIEIDWIMDKDYYKELINDYINGK